MYIRSAAAESGQRTALDSTCSRVKASWSTWLPMSSTRFTYASTCAPRGSPLLHLPPTATPPTPLCRRHRRRPGLLLPSQVQSSRDLPGRLRAAG